MHIDSYASSNNKKGVMNLKESGKANMGVSGERNGQGRVI